MTESLPPLLSLSLDPRARLVLFDIADDPRYVAMEVQVFDDETHGRGLLALLARHDATVDIYRAAGLRLDRGPFSIGRGIGEWREADFGPSHVEIVEDGIVVDVAFTDVHGQRVEVRIDDRDGEPRGRSTLLAPVSSGVETPRQLLVVLLREFDLVRTSGIEPWLSIGGARRTVAAFPGPAWVHHRRFIRYSAAPVILSVGPDVDGPVDAMSLGPLGRVDATIDGASAALRFTPPLPDLAGLTDGSADGGTWALDVADQAPLFGGTWTASRSGDTARVTMTVTEPWRPRDLPRSLRFVTTAARVFRQWPTTYAWSASVELAAAPVARTGWRRITPPDRSNAYGVRIDRRGLGLVIAAGLVTTAVAVAAAVRRARGRRA
jgi:hypothetical protein